MAKEMLFIIVRNCAAISTSTWLQVSRQLDFLVVIASQSFMFTSATNICSMHGDKASSEHELVSHHLDVALVLKFFISFVKLQLLDKYLWVLKWPPALKKNESFSLSNKRLQQCGWCDFGNRCWLKAISLVFTLKTF